MHCGHMVDDEALRTGERGTNPIWAERKYGTIRTLTDLVMAAHAKQPKPGSDCENMLFDDGRDCRVWEKKNT